MQEISSIYRHLILGLTVCLLPLAAGTEAHAAAATATATAVPGPAQIQGVAENDPRRDVVVRAIEKLTPSVVNIATRTRVQQRQIFYDWFRRSWGVTRELPPQSSAGSGVIIDEDGYIITNIHVVEGATEIWVKLWDDRPPIRATLVAGMAKSDVALLKLQAKPEEKFIAARFAANDDLLLGETVIALGNPFGLGNSVSRGILSAKNRRATSREERLDIPDWLQTDAAINPGNSGGPLINTRGEVIGINVAVSAEGQGIGFAIPVRQVSEALTEFFTPELHRSLWLGLRMKAGSGPLVIQSVQPGSPAEKAGLRPGDQVREVNGREPRTLMDYTRHLVENESKDVKITVVRDGRTLSPLAVRLLPLGEMVRQRLGLTVQELTPDLAREMGINEGYGLLIAEVEEGGPAGVAELRHGYLLAGIAGERVGSVMKAASVLSELKKGDTAELHVLVPQRRTRANPRYLEGVTSVKVR